MDDMEAHRSARADVSGSKEEYTRAKVIFAATRKQMLHLVLSLN